MATPEQLREVCHRYVETFGSDTDAWASLFTADAEQEDPVGSPPNVGRDAIRRFLETNKATFGAMTLELRADPIVLGHEAVMELQAVVGLGADRARLPQIVDVVTFDDDGAITGLRAFYDMTTLTPDPSG